MTQQNNMVLVQVQQIKKSYHFGTAQQHDISMLLLLIVYQALSDLILSIMLKENQVKTKNKMQNPA